MTLITIVSLLNVIMVISLTTTTTLAVLTFHHIRTSSKVAFYYIYGLPLVTLVLLGKLGLLLRYSDR